MMHEDLYKVLGVKRDASPKEIRDAYRRLARRLHPDLNPGDSSAEERFKRVNRAYQTLSNEKTRRDYDEFGEHWERADDLRKAGAGSVPGGSRWFSSAHEAPMGESLFGDLGDLLNGFGVRSGRAAPPRRYARQEVAVKITLEEAYRGSSRIISYERPERCSSCGGAGFRGGAPCVACHASGATPKPVRLEVKIPAGIEDGGRIRLQPDPHTEIVLRVEVLPHERFRRSGADLHTRVKVGYLDAILGGEVEVPTMNGKVALKIPAGARSDTSFRIAGKGMPRIGGAGHGDLYAELSITVPDSVSKEERALLKQIREIRAGAGVGTS